MMPAGAADARADEIAEIGVVIHELTTDPRLGDWFDQSVQQGEALDDWQRANLAEMKRSWHHARAVPSDLVAAKSRATAACEMAWRDARPRNDYGAVRPLLAEVLALVKETAAAKAAAFACAPYDALLDQHDPGLRIAEIDPMFAELADFLPDFTDNVLAAQARQPPPLPFDGPFPADQQRMIAEKLMAAVGFPFDCGRLDVSAHPFSGGTPDDLRITTRFDETDFTSGLMAVLHETGHALYERGLPQAWRHQPVGRARGMAMHESQSLLIEMQACRNLDFLTHAAPLIAEGFGRSGPEWSAENLYRHYTRVTRGLIRVDADEVTYPSHVIVRYRLERAIIAGDLALADLPAAWHDGMIELVGVAPLDDRDGCMQDIHWFEGIFGYFPTYTLGAIAAAQLFATAVDADPAIPQALGVGDFAPLYAWLGPNIHAKGSLVSTPDLLTEATGRSFDVAAFTAHLRRRYLSRD